MYTCGSSYLLTDRVAPGCGLGVGGDHRKSCTGLGRRSLLQHGQQETEKQERRKREMVVVETDTNKKKIQVRITVIRKQITDCGLIDMHTQSMTLLRNHWGTQMRPCSWYMLGTFHTQMASCVSQGVSWASCMWNSMMVQSFMWLLALKKCTGCARCCCNHILEHIRISLAYTLFHHWRVWENEPLENCRQVYLSPCLSVGAHKYSCTRQVCLTLAFCLLSKSYTEAKKVPQASEMEKT